MSKSLTMKEYENLAFEGGGVKGIAYAGAITELEALGKLDSLKRVAGTSAGAITAVLLSLRYSAKEIYSIVESTDFATFEDHKDIARVLTKYGIYKGEAFLNWMKKQVAAKTGNEMSTFADLQKAGMRDLVVFACDLNTKSVKRFSFATTPNVVVAEAARASMSIPLFFQAWQFTNDNPDNHIYVDGGTAYNYPVTAFDSNGFNEKTLGLYLDNMDAKVEDSGLGYNHVIKYVEAVFEIVLGAQRLDFKNDPKDQARTVKVNDFGISGTNFNLSQVDKDKLYNSGIASVKAFFAAQA